MISTGGHLTILESVDSTNNYAMAMVRNGLAKHGDGFFAMAQLQGKGQRGKTWQTEPGTNIICTLVMQPLTIALSQQFAFNTAVSLAVRDFFDGRTGGDTSIKWPNDIYWRDRKAGGILIENIIAGHETEQGHAASGIGPPLSSATGLQIPSTQQPTPNTPAWQWAIVGMGVNINQTSFPENIRNAVSLKQITGKDHDVIELAKELCAHVQSRYSQLLAGNHLLQEYNQQLFKKGSTVTLKKGNRVFEARIKEVTATGELVVITSMEEQFGFGEIEWRF